MEQSNPIRGQQAVTPIARSAFNDLLTKRETKGIQTYGRTLETFNGRSAIQDAKEELIDAWQYLIQIELEQFATKRDAFILARNVVHMWRNTAIERNEPLTAIDGIISSLTKLIDHDPNSQAGMPVPPKKGQCYQCKRHTIVRSYGGLPLCIACASDQTS